MKRKPRTIKVLLELVLDNSCFINEGLCDLIRRLQARGVISIKEHWILRQYFIDNEYPDGTAFRPYWWKPGEVVPRRKWLKLQISRYSAEPKKPMNKFVKIELITWGIFLISVLIIVVPMSILLNALNVSENTNMWISFGVGFVLMFVIGRVVRKRME
jgi:hypothetical protein